MGAAAWWVLLAILAAPTAVAAEEAVFEGQVAGVPRIAGIAAGHVGMAAMSSNGFVDVTIQGAGMRLVQMRELAIQANASATPLTPAITSDDLGPSDDHEVLRDERLDGAIRLVGGSGSIRFLAQDAMLEAELGPTMELWPAPEGASHQAYNPVFEGQATELPSNAPQFAWDAATPVSGEAFVMVHGGTVIVAGEAIQTGDLPAEEAPLGNGQLALVNRTFVVLQGKMVANMAGPWIAYAATLEASGPRLAIAMSAPRQTAGWLDAPRSASMVEVIGDLQVTGQLAGSEWQIVGNVHQVKVDGVAVASHPLELAPAAFVGGAVALAWVAKLASPSLAAWLAGYTRAEPLANDVRRRLLDLVRKSSGITAADLSRQLGVTRPTVAFHGRVLADHGFVSPRRVGWQWRYFKPDEARPATEEYALRHPLRNALYRTLAVQPMPRPAAVLQRQVEGSPSIALVSYHLGVLMKNGLVQRDASGCFSVAQPAARPDVEVNLAA